MSERPSPGRGSDRGRRAGRRDRSRRRRAPTRSGRPPMRGCHPRPGGDRGGHGPADGAGCERRRNPPCVALRTRRAAGWPRPGWRGGSPTRDRAERGALGAGARGRCDGHGYARSGRQASPALEPARPQHVASRTGRHAVTEAVLLGTASVVGLEGALHGVPPRPSGLLAGRRSMLIDVGSGAGRAVAQIRRARHRLGATLEGARRVRQHRPRATVRHPPGTVVPDHVPAGRRHRFSTRVDVAVERGPSIRGVGAGGPSRPAVDSVCCGVA